MTNWKKVRIEQVLLAEGNYVRLEFDEKWGEKTLIHFNSSVYFFDCYPFNTFQAGDEVEIDTDKINEFEENVNRVYNNSSYKQTGTISAIVETRINDESLIRLVKCRLQETMALVSRNSTELNSVRRERDDLKTRNYDLQRERDSYQNLVRVGEKELIIKNEQIREIGKDRDDYKNKWVLSENEVRRIVDLFNNLQIENNNKDKEIEKKEKEIEEKLKKIKELKGELNISREEFLDQKIHLKEERLEALIQQFGVNLRRIRDLRNAYEDSFYARQECNRNNRRTAEEKIDTIKQELLGGIFGEVGRENTQKICRKCEKLVKLEIEHEKLLREQQQYQSQQEHPTDN